MLHDWPFERAGFAEWRQRRSEEWASACPTGPGCQVHAPSFPPLPTDDFTLFRAACRDRLLRADFAVVDALWRESRDATVAWLEGNADIDEVAVAEFLRDLVRPATSYGQVVTRLRGAQAAFFLSGWLVKVNHERLAASAIQEPYDLLTPGNAELLRGFVVPRYGAAATLAQLLHEPPEALATLTCGDVAPDGSTVTWRGGPSPVPYAFVALVRAQRMDRTIDGAAPSDPLFVFHPMGKQRRSGNANEPMTGYAVQTMLRTVARETGVLVATEFSGRMSNATAHHWAHRRGVSITTLRPTNKRLKLAS